MHVFEIAKYDPPWPTMFAEEAALRRQVLDAHLLLSIEHFGSTAVPGVTAKPIINILIAVQSLTEARAKVIEPVQRSGTFSRQTIRKPNRMFFVNGMPPFGARRAHSGIISEPSR